MLARTGESASECVLKGSKIVEGVIVIKGDPRLMCGNRKSKGHKNEGVCN